MSALNGAFVFGPSESDMRPVEFILTDKYILIREVSAVNTVDSNDAKNSSYAFYDLKEIDRVIYPYYTKRFGKSPVFRFVNLDGTDFVLSFGFVQKTLDKLAQTFMSVGLMVATGARVYDICCEKPFVDFDSCIKRVSISAAQFVELADGQFVAPRILPEKHEVVPPVPTIDTESIVDWSSEWEKTVSDIAAPPVEVEEEPAPDTPSIVDWSSEWEKTVSDIAAPPVEVEEEPAPDTSLIVDWSSEWEKTVSDIAAPPVEVEEEPAPDTPSIVDWSSEWEKTVSDIAAPPVEVEEEPAPDTPSIVDWSSEWEKTVSDIAAPPVEVEEELTPDTPSIVDWSSEWEKTVSDIAAPPVEVEEELTPDTPSIVDWSSEWEKTVSDIAAPPVKIEEKTVPMAFDEWKKLWELI